MAATAELIETPPIQNLEYAHSKRTVAAWGASRAMERSVTLQLVDEQKSPNSHEELSRDDYVGALREMLRTAEGFSDYLDIEDEREHDVSDGQVRAADGTPMALITKRGREAAERLAEKQPKFSPLVDRDAGDEIIAQKVDKLRPGQVLFAVTMDPKEELKKERQSLEKPFQRKGYRDGLVFVQAYAMTHENKLVAFSYSVDKSNVDSWRAMMAKRGVNIPADVDPNEFIHYSFEVTATPQEARQQLKDMRDEYYKSVGVTGKRYSVSEYVEKNHAIVQGFFDVYYPSLADAAHTGKNNPVMKSFAQTILAAKIKKLDPEVRQSMIRVANGNTFDDEAVKNMDSILRYAVVEELRKGLPAFIANHTASVKFDEQQPMMWPNSPNQSQSIPGMSIQHTNQLLTRNLASGINAGRTYGGCPAVTLAKEGDTWGVNSDSNAAGGDSENPQSAYGGRGCKSIKDGMATTCPHCKQKVKTVVPKEGGEVFCSNDRCSKAAARHVTSWGISKNNSNKSPKLPVKVSFNQEKKSFKLPKNKELGKVALTTA